MSLLMGVGDGSLTNTTPLLDDFDRFWEYAIRASALYINYVFFMTEKKKFLLSGESEEVKTLNWRIDVMSQYQYSPMLLPMIPKAIHLYAEVFERLKELDQHCVLADRIEPITPMISAMSQSPPSVGEQLSLYREWEGRQRLTLGKYFANTLPALGFSAEGVVITYDDMKFISGPTPAEFIPDGVSLPC